MIWWLFLTYLCGVLFMFGVPLVGITFIPGCWELVRDEMYDEAPELEDESERFLLFCFQCGMFLSALLWPLWAVRGVYRKLFQNDGPVGM